MIQIDKIKHVLVFFIANILLSCSQENKNKITCGLDSVYWDAEIGNSWYLNKNGVALWYQYKNNERFLVDFGDVRIDHFKWEINHDTIYFYADNDTMPMAKYQIVNIVDKRMNVYGLGVYSRYKPIRFRFSPNQFQKPKPSREYERYEFDSSGNLIKTYSTFP